MKSDWGTKVTNIAGHTYYTLEAADFNAMLCQRVKELEANRMALTIQMVEMEAVRTLVGADGMEAYEKDCGVVESQLKEVDLRIEALRGLTPELDKPKV